MKKKIKGLREEFKQFIARGNVLDLAVAVIIGAAFSKIVTSLVNDMVMPLITGAIGGHSLTDLSWIIKPEVLASDGSVLQPALAVKWGSFLQNIIDFLIIAFIVFAFVKIITAAKSASGRLQSEAKDFIREHSKLNWLEEEKEAENDATAEPEVQEEGLEENTKEDSTHNIEKILTEIKDLLAGKQKEN